MATEYIKLIEKLRDDSMLENCEFDFVHKYMHEAADAIEELQKITTHYEEESKGWWLAACDAKEERERLKEQIPKWIPVTERLPEEKDSGFSADVLILVKEQDGDFIWEDVYSGYYLYDAVSSETGWWAQMPQNCERVEERFSVTHWMPIPQPPEDGEP